MGIYIFNRDFLNKCLKEDAASIDSPHDFGYAILPRIVRTERVFGYEFGGYWQDIGTVEAYYEANMQLLGGKPEFKADDSWPVLTIYGKTATPLTAADNIVNSLISPECVVEGYVENSILSPGVRVEEKARVVDSIVMAHTHIGYHSVVDRCILDEGVNIDKFCYLGFGSAPQTQFSDITMVGKAVNLGPQIAIGRKSKIMPGLSLADLKSKFVAPGTILSVGVSA
jgi:glucose-1-phosphate adenylyltransferase